MKLCSALLVLFAGLVVYSPKHVQAAGDGAQKEKSAEEHGDGHEKDQENHKIQGHVIGSINNIKIPKQLIRKMESLFVEEFKKSDPIRAAQLTKAEIMLNSNRKYLNLKVEVYDDRGGVVPRPVVFKPPNGGGIIDLGPFVSQARGNFYFKVNAYLDEGHGYDHEADKLKVFYLSNSKKRRVLDETIGAGCNLFMDITQFYNYKIKKAGVKVNSTQRRFISILGGSFFFIYAKNDELHLASLEVTDSLGEKFLCRN